MLTKSGRGPPFEMERYVSLDFQRYLENHMTRLNTIFGNWKQQFSHWPLATAILCAAVLSFPLAPAVKHTAGIQGPQSILTAKMGTVLCSVPKKGSCLQLVIFGSPMEWEVSKTSNPHQHLLHRVRPERTTGNHSILGHFPTPHMIISLSSMKSLGILGLSQTNSQKKGAPYLKYHDHSWS